MEKKTCGKNGSRKTALNENGPPALILTLILNQTLTLTGEQFSSGAIFRTPEKTYLACYYLIYLKV